MVAQSPCLFQPAVESKHDTQTRVKPLRANALSFVGVAPTAQQFIVHLVPIEALRFSKPYEASQDFRILIDSTQKVAIFNY
jgi:hypothetical protein